MRSKQAETTRTTILDAFQQQLADPEDVNLSLADVTARAGVSTATFFRHFPTKEALFEAFRERAGRKFNVSPELVDDLAAVGSRVEALFSYFRENRELLAAGRRVPELAQYAKRIRSERARRIRELVSRRYPTLDERESAAVAGILHLLLGAQSWSWLEGECGLEHGRATSAVRWAFDTLLRRLDETGGRMTLPESEQKEQTT